MSVELIPIGGLPEIEPGDDLAALLAPPLRTAGVRDGDVVVVTQKVVSKAEGRLVPDEDRAEVIAAETRRVVARRGDLVIAETAHGFVCANAGVDASNVAAGMLSLLPVDPDASAARLRSSLSGTLGVTLGVVITDTFGRAWREGVVNVAIGCAGLPALVDLRGGRDHHGRELEVTVIGLADEVAAASGLVIAKDAHVPAAIVRGVDLTGGPAGTARDLVRSAEGDLFRESPLQALRTRRDADAFAPGPVGRDAIEEAVRAACLAVRDVPILFVGLDAPASRRRVETALPDGPPGAAALVVPAISFDRAQALTEERRHAEQERALLRAGAAIQQLVLALHAQGLAAAWSDAGLFDQEAAREALGLEPGWFALGTVAVGRMPEGGASRPRPPIDLSSLLRWG